MIIYFKEKNEGFLEVARSDLEKLIDPSRLSLLFLLLLLLLIL
jgi:hypothetical protein